MKMYGVTFGDKHSYDDWGIYLTGNRSEFPKPRALLSDVPFRNGLVSVSKALSPFMMYEARKVTYEFSIIDNKKTWPELYAEIAGDILGQELSIITDMDPDYHWHAYNCEISEPSPEEDISNITIVCTCFPYKMANMPTMRKKLITGTGIPVDCLNSRMEVYPVINTTAPVRIGYYDINGEVHVEILNAGDNQLRDLVFVKGNNQLKFSKLSDDATVTITYREGDF